MNDTTNAASAQSLSAAIMAEVKRYNDGMGCTRRQLVDSILIAIDQSSRVSDGGVVATKYADGYCAQCSELAYPLTRALEKTGVPTGADNWQQTYGPNKVRALADLETCLRRLLNALEEGKPEEIKSRIEWANHFIEFHAAIRRRLTAQAQQGDATATASPAAQSPILAFDAWLQRWVTDNGRKLTQDEYAIAYAAFIAAHPGEGPQAHVMSPAAPKEEDDLAQWSSVDNWPLPDVLNKLADATECLLHDYNYDRDGWEQLKYAALAARRHVALLTATPSPDAQQRRTCSTCGEDLGFNEGDPCSKCVN